MSRMKKLGVAVAVSAVIAAAAAATYQYTTDGFGTSLAGGTEGGVSGGGAQAQAGIGNGGNGGSLAGATGSGGQDNIQKTYIVLFRDAPLASYKGTVPGIAAPERVRDESGMVRLDATGDNAQEYVDYLETRQAQLENQMSTITGRDINARHSMQHAVNGIVVDLSDSEAKSVRGMAGVALVEEYREYALDTDVGPQLIGAVPVWTGTNPGASGPYRGEGVVVGIIDSGVNFGSPSFAGVGPVDGFTHTNPFGAGVYLGTCATGGVDEGRCNDKLIGGYDFVCGAPANTCGQPNIREEPGFGDTNSHGSHTASTVAGNVRDALFSGNTVRISGVAPHANVIAYDACYTNTATGQGLCPNTSTVASIDQAIADGVDVINYSIGGGRDPWSEATSLAFLNASDAGIYIATSAGNSGPAADSMGHHEPWTASTAAAQHGRDGYSVALSVTGPAPVPANLAPILVNQGTGGVTFGATIPGTTPLMISAGYNTTSDGCAAYPANTFAGGIAVIKRGTCSFSIKVNNAAAAGAVAVVIANNAAGVILPSVPGTTIPVFSVLQTEGDALRDFGNANPATATAQITFPAIAVPNTPDVLAGFSSRGPAGTYNLLKPDLTAPGVQVLAVTAGTTLTGSEQSVGLLSGTSMASPHNAGAAALIRQARPTWTPSEVKSAMAMTATQTVYLEDGVTLANPFARGSGRIRVDQAINAGLVLNETTANYQAANPATGGDPTRLNQANLINRSCYPTCAFTRTFRNTSSQAVSWQIALQGVTGTVTPMVTVPANGSISVKFTVYAFSYPANGGWNFGNAVLTSVPTAAGQQAQVLRLPIAVSVQPPSVSLPASVNGTAAVNATNSSYFTLGNTGGTTLTYSFVTSGTGVRRIHNADNTGVASGFRNTIYTDPATAGSQAQFAADDFVLAEPVQITNLAADGFVVSGAALTAAATNLTWSIYPDAAGFPAGNPQSNPAAAVWTYTATPAGTGVSTTSTGTINLDLVAAGQTVNLPAGRYWLVVNTRGTFANRWAQYGSTTTSGNAGFASITVATNGTGNWVANPSFAGLSFRISGGVSCAPASWMGGTFATSGSLARGASRSVLQVFYAAGLAPGNYSAHLCVQSNDPVTPRAAVPVNFTVTP